MSNKVYDWLKWLSLTLVPASATLVSVLGDAWGWEEALVTAIVRTITGVGTFLGALLGISSIRYNK